MLTSRQKTVITTLVAAVAVFALAALIFAADPGDGAMKLEGAWVARVVSYQGVPGQYPFQWSYILAQDPSGRSASLHGTIDVGFPQSPLLPYDFYTPIIGEIVQIGPNAAAFNSHWYYIIKGPINQIVAIGRNWGEVRFMESGKSEVTHHIEIYPPSADTNGDGIPEGSPITQFTVTTVDTRIPPPVR